MAFRNLLTAAEFNIFSFGGLVTSEDAAINSSYEMGLIPRIAICPRGHGVMHRKIELDRKLSYRWRCNACNSTVSCLKHTFYSRTKLDFSTVLKLIGLWFWRIPVSQAFKHAGVTKKTAVDFYNLAFWFLRLKVKGQ